MQLHVLQYFLPVCVLLGLAATACEKPVDFDAVEMQQELVVISNFTSNRALHVVVTKTRSVFETGEEYPYVPNAKVDLYLDDGTFMESLEFNQRKNEQGFPFYTTTGFSPQPNEVYLLKVSAPGYASVTARSQIPTPIELSGVAMRNFSSQLLGSSGELELTYELQVDFDDPDQEKNYYHINLVQELQQYNVVEGDTNLIGVIQEPLLFDPRQNTKERVAHLGGGVLIQDDAFDGTSFNYNLPVRFAYDPQEYRLGQLIVELRVVSEEYYFYFVSLSRQHAAKGQPLSEPVFVFNNVEGGKGVFAGYSGSRDSLLLSR
ncbi:MAG TPA: DUF4249 domain-containing protein [Phaeodactylibacter sp.]|nr:DUF4249 domain-containing protein [Phaeodactylibacter sp.]